MRGSRNDVLVHEDRAVVAGRCQWVGDCRRSARVLELEQPAERQHDARIPCLLTGDQRPPWSPKRGVERDMLFRNRAVPDRLGSAGPQVVALHARLCRFEHREQVAPGVAAGLIDGVHVPVTRVRLIGRQLRVAIGDRSLAELRIAERDRSGFVRRRRRRSCERREIRKTHRGAVAVGDGDSAHEAAADNGEPRAKRRCSIGD